MNLIWLPGVLATALEGLAVLQLLSSSDWADLAAWSTVHACACALFAWSFAHWLLPQDRARSRDAAVLGFALACMLPLFGMLGILLMLASVRWQHAEPSAPPQWLQLQTPELPVSAPLVGAAGVFAGPRNLDAILHNAPNAPTRLAALMRTLRLPDAQAAVLLRKALKDQDEEVRLLAYALLNRKEKVVEARIDGLRHELEANVATQLFSQHRALAYAYWELYLLGAQPVADASPLLVYACEHARSALALQPEEPGLQFLLGRALLRQKMWDAAQQAFNDAEKAGMVPQKIQPYRAEIEWMRQGHHPLKSGQWLDAAFAHPGRLIPSWGGPEHGTANA